jgi:anti-anti-sigma factor
MSNAAGLEAAVLEAADEAAVVVVDLTGLDYLDSAGTRSVHRLSSACRARRQELRLAAAPGSTARRLLDLVGMAETVTVADTVEQAQAP